MNPQQTFRTRWKKVSLPNKLTVLCTAIIAVATVAYVIIAGRTLNTIRNQLDAITESNRIARDTFDAANRPYIGVEDIATVHSRLDHGKWIHGRDRTPDSVDMTFTIRLKNFGSVPATNAHGYYRLFFGGKEVKGSGAAGTGTATMYPGVGYNLVGEVGTANYSAVISGQNTLEAWCIISYEWPGHKYGECTREVYDPTFNTFSNLGSCPP